MDMDLTCRDASISPSGYRSMTVSVSNVDVGEILDMIDIKEIIKHYPTKELLEHINISDVIDHYGEEELFNSMDLSANFVEIRNDK